MNQLMKHATLKTRWSFVDPYVLDTSYDVALHYTNINELDILNDEDFYMIMRWVDLLPCDEDEIHIRATALEEMVNYVKDNGMQIKNQTDRFDFCIKFG